MFPQPDLKKVDSEIQRRIKDLATEIENLKSETGLGYIECTVEVCERLGIEIETMKKVLPKNIKEKIELEASELNLLKYKINKIL